MTNAKEIFEYVKGNIALAVSQGERRAIALRIVEKFFGLTESQILSGASIDRKNFSDALEDAIDRVNREEPVQYILGEESFYGRKFDVDPSVLIPRPETELLVKLVMEKIRVFKDDRDTWNILDIGTGSGCIAITLALELENVHVWATDVRGEILQLARSNAITHRAVVSFMEHNILRSAIGLRDLHVVVSNPPYVGRDEKDTLAANVLNYEPHLALFPPEDDPLIFYKAISGRAFESLVPGGLLATEINERYGEDVRRIFSNAGFVDIIIERDISGKNRVVTGVKPE